MVFGLFVVSIGNRSKKARRWFLGVRRDGAGSLSGELREWQQHTTTEYWHTSGDFQHHGYGYFRHDACSHAKRNRDALTGPKHSAPGCCSSINFPQFFGAACFCRT